MMVLLVVKIYIINNLLEIKTKLKYELTNNNNICFRLIYSFIKKNYKFQYLINIFNLRIWISYEMDDSVTDKWGLLTDALLFSQLINSGNGNEYCSHKPDLT